jgi:hypothetical protein
MNSHLIYFFTIDKNCSLYTLPWPIWVIKECCKSCFVVHRWFGSFFKQFETKSASLSEKPTTVGGYSLAILYIARNGGNLK